MGVTDRLVKLDAKVLPRPRARYDTRPPVWFTFSGAILALLGSAIGQFVVHTAGIVRVVVLVVLIAVAAGVLGAFWRWHRAHRVPRP